MNFRNFNLSKAVKVNLQVFGDLWNHQCLSLLPIYMNHKKATTNRLYLIWYSTIIDSQKWFWHSKIILIFSYSHLSLLLQCPLLSVKLTTVIQIAEDEGIWERLPLVRHSTDKTSPQNQQSSIKFILENNIGSSK